MDLSEFGGVGKRRANRCERHGSEICEPGIEGRLRPPGPQGGCGSSWERHGEEVAWLGWGALILGGIGALGNLADERASSSDSSGVREPTCPSPC